MPDSYLLPCSECGEAHSVRVSQAGSTVGCACGAALEVPTIRQIQQLEPVGEPATAKNSGWTARRGVVLFGGILAVAAFLPGAYWFATWPAPPERDVPGVIEHNAEQIAKMPIDQAWRYWHQLRIASTLDAVAPDRAAYEKRSQTLRWYCYASSVVAAIGVFIAAAALLTKPKRIP